MTSVDRVDIGGWSMAVAVLGGITWTPMGDAAAEDLVPVLMVPNLCAWLLGGILLLGLVWFFAWLYLPFDEVTEP